MASERIRIRSALNLNLFIMQFFGLWAPESFFGTPKIYLYRIYSMLVLGFFFFVYTLTEIINIIMVFGNIDQTVEASFLLMTHASQFVKTVLLLVKNEEILRLVVKLDESMFNRAKAEHNALMEVKMKTVRRDTRWFLGSAFGTCVLWALFPALNPARELPLKAWYPFDALRTPVFQTIYSYQIIAVALCGFANISMDTLGSGLMALTQGLLDILHYEIASLWRPSTPIEKGDEYMHKRLNDCIVLHQEIIKYVHEQESAFYPMYLAQFVVGVLVICLTVVELTLVPIGLKFFSMILYLVCMLVEIFLYCYHGNEIMLKSFDIPDAIMKSGWYEEDDKFNRKLLIIMLKAKEPLQVTTAKLFSLSLATFIMILKSSYSYYALLQNVREV